MASEIIVISSDENEGASGTDELMQNVDEAREADPPDLQNQDANSSGKMLFKQKWHVLDEKNTFFKDSTRVAKVLLCPPRSKVNNSVPTGCDEELTFLIDSSKLRYSQDLTCDETGKYLKCSRSKCTVELENETYTLVRKYYKHRDTQNFQRTIYEMHKGEDIHSICMIRYEWRGEKTELVFTPHGNMKNTDRPYIRSKKELIEQLKVSKRSSAQKIMNTFYDKEGGANMQSFGSVPRDTNQVYRHGMAKGNASDFSELLKLNLKGEFVKSVEFRHMKNMGSKPRCVLFTDQQAQDLKRYCSEGSSVLMFDATFDCGPMYVTVASYRHDQFVNRRNKRPVLMPGPILLHAQKDEDSYNYFGNEISKSINNAGVHFYGTDGEVALHKGLGRAQSFTNSEHLHCMIHHKANCEKKLKDLGVKKNTRRILRSIYGEQIEDTRYEGLADAETEAEYEMKLATWITQWDALEAEETGREPQFSTWFQRFKSLDIKKGMLKTLRRRAGLGDPPRQFTTNDSESINSMVSKWICGKKSWDQLAKCLQEFVASKYQELEMAVLGIGDRQMAPGFQNLQKTPLQWRKMSLNEKREVLQEANLTSEEPKSLSIGPEESGVCGFTSSELNDVWQKAGQILVSPRNIVSFPSNDNQSVCFSEDTNYTVTQKATGRFVCGDSCRSYIFHERLLCEHCLAVAETKGLLAEFLIMINTKKGASSVSLVNRALQKQCSRSGQKQATKRKGANNTIGCEVKRVVRTPCSPQPFCVARKIGLISKCYGCRKKFGEKMNVPPCDLILRKMDFREWNDKNSGELRRSRSLVPTYYHLKMDCVRINFPTTQIKDILLHDEVKDHLNEQHFRKLDRFGIDIE